MSGLSSCHHRNGRYVPLISSQDGGAFIWRTRLMEKDHGVDTAR